MLTHFDWQYLVVPWVRHTHPHTHPPPFPVVCVRTWTWERRWMRAHGFRGRTATTLTSLSSTTTWTMPLRYYRPPWTNSALNRSGFQSTGSIDLVGCSDWVYWPGGLQWLGLLTWWVAVTVRDCVCFQTPWQRDQRSYFCKKNIQLCCYCKNNFCVLFPRFTRHTMQLFTPQRERVLIYFSICNFLWNNSISICTNVEFT